MHEGFQNQNSAGGYAVLGGSIKGGVALGDLSTQAQSRKPAIREQMDRLQKVIHGLTETVEALHVRLEPITANDKGAAGNAISDQEPQQTKLGAELSDAVERIHGLSRAVHLLMNRLEI